MKSTMAAKHTTMILLSVMLTPYPSCLFCHKCQIVSIANITYFSTGIPREYMECF